MVPMTKAHSAQQMPDVQTLTPSAQHEKHLDNMLDQLIAWGEALRGIRAQRLDAAA